MFILRKSYPFTATVKVPEGAVPACEFRACFEAVTQSEIDELAQPGTGLIDSRVAARVFKGWVHGDVVDMEGNAVPVTPETVAAMIAIPFIRLHIVRAYFDVINATANT